jgi:hypothetical protein
LVVLRVLAPRALFSGIGVTAIDLAKVHAKAWENVVNFHLISF